MNNPPHNENLPKYGNWMPKKFPIIGFCLSFISIVIALAISIVWIKTVLFIFGAFCGLMAIYAVNAYYLFSPKGGNLQGKIHTYIIDLLPWDGQGKCLEIGCGNAPISISLAKKYHSAKIIASDYWGETYFEYSKNQSMQNAVVEGVIDQLEFRFANAMDLPFENESLDAVISNLTFHEVNLQNKKDQYSPILEALRVLKKGGAFAFQDLFNIKLIFGDFEKLRDILKAHVEELHWVDSFQVLKIPKSLNNVMMLQGLGVFFGKK
jgi:SAM-dependent methyltransferase